ncbi:unnamed protein product [Peronospora effusa]|uniref:ACB domain-containing protein n=1 Tax=Peronospora effusa TaxID=542832 RepID=A0A3R7VYC2_9STRA|nr:hypothetical protein DD237_006288 [Peronospora effusa]CAI5701022.1 unnamed protein product [Peronospora effusa]
MPLLAPSLLNSVVSQATGVQSIRARLFSTALSLEEEDDDVDDVETVDLRSTLSSSVASSRTRSHSTGESYAQLEMDFNAAVLFVESYQGPHRILTQENSFPKKNLYAFYQQATVGPCPTTTSSVGLSELELSKWKKWQQLGHMTNQEAMKCYMTVLDDLVDDWRRSANVWSSSMGTSDDFTDRRSTDGDTATPNRLKRSISMFEHLPLMNGKLRELQDRIEDEATKRNELETHLLHVTRDTRDMFVEQNGQMEQICKNLMTLVKNLEDNVMQHSTELQRLTMWQQQVMTQAENSISVAVKARVGHVFVILKRWLQKRSIRAALVVFIGVRMWHFVWRHRLPQFLVQLLIRWLIKVSSLDRRNNNRQVL